MSKEKERARERIDAWKRVEEKGRNRTITITLQGNYRILLHRGSRN